MLPSRKVFFQGELEQLANRPKLRSVDSLLLLVAIVWGSSYLAAKTLTEHGPIAGMLSLRFSLAALLMGLIWAIGFSRGKFTKFGIWDFHLGALWGGLVGLIMWIETNSISLTSATNAGLIISLTIVFTPIFESIWSRHWLPPKFFVACTGAVVGVALLVGAGGIQNINFGDLIMLIAAVIRAWTTTAQSKLTAGKPVSSFNMTTVQFAVIGLGYLILVPSEVVETAAGYGLQQWLVLLYLVIFASVFGFVGLMFGIRKTSASRASLLLSTEPVWAVVIATSLGGETLGWLGLAGAAMIIGFSYWGLGLEASWRRPTQPEPQS